MYYVSGIVFLESGLPGQICKKFVNHKKPNMKVMHSFDLPYYYLGLRIGKGNSTVCFDLSFARLGFRTGKSGMGIEMIGFPG